MQLVGEIQMNVQTQILVILKVNLLCSVNIKVRKNILTRFLALDNQLLMNQKIYKI